MGGCLKCYTVFMNNELFELSSEYGKNGNIEEWVHVFLLGSGNNVPLSDGLKKTKRYWVGPIEYDVSKLIRVGGPEEGKEYPETQETWDARIEEMLKDLEHGWKPAPLIAEYKNGEIKVRDGGHRLAAFEKTRLKKVWVVIWSNNEEDYKELNKQY